MGAHHPPLRTPRGTRPTVLVAEDDPLGRLLARRLLGRMDVDLSLAANGREAVDRWREGGVDVILMDCLMPGLDGYGATEQIRAAERDGGLPHVPIIALTADALPGSRRQCLLRGMDDHLLKPVRPGTLRDRIARWLGSPTPVRRGAQDTAGPNLPTQ